MGITEKEKSERTTEYIYNPATKKYVLRSGRIGKAIEVLSASGKILGTKLGLVKPSKKKEPEPLKMGERDEEPQPPPLIIHPPVEQPEMIQLPPPVPPEPMQFIRRGPSLVDPVIPQRGEEYKKLAAETLRLKNVETPGKLPEFSVLKPQTQVPVQFPNVDIGSEIASREVQISRMKAYEAKVAKQKEAREMHEQTGNPAFTIREIEEPFIEEPFSRTNVQGMEMITTPKQLELIEEKQDIQTGILGEENISLPSQRSKTSNSDASSYSSTRYGGPSSSESGGSNTSSENKPNSSILSDESLTPSELEEIVNDTDFMELLESTTHGEINRDNIGSFRHLKQFRKIYLEEQHTYGTPGVVISSAISKSRVRREFIDAFKTYGYISDDDEMDGTYNFFMPPEPDKSSEPSEVENMNNNVGNNSAPLEPFATRTIEDKHPPKYHKEAILLYFGDDVRPDWDLELEKNIFDSKIEAKSRVQIMDGIISINGCRIFVFQRVSDTLEELNEIVQLHFCLQRNMSRGYRTKTALVPISALNTMSQMLGGTRPPQNPQNPQNLQSGDNVEQDPLESASALDEVDPAEETFQQQGGLVSVGNSIQYQIDANAGREKIVTALRNRPYNLYGRPTVIPDVVKMTGVHRTNHLGPNNAKDPGGLLVKYNFRVQKPPNKTKKNKIMMKINELHNLREDSCQGDPKSGC